MKMHYTLIMWLVLMVVFTLIGGESSFILRVFLAAIPSTWITGGVYYFLEKQKREKEEEERRAREAISTGRWNWNNGRQ